MATQPKKELGQHWLHDAASLNAMIEMAEVSAEDNVLEIGPGLGTLTAHILAAGARLQAVEYDRDLYVKLGNQAEKLFKQNVKRLELINQDILQFDLTSMPPDYKVVANIPYYLTSHLIRILSETSNQPQSITLLIQKEVAQRIAAGPGDMSMLTVTAQMYYEPALGPLVPAELFTPPPKIDSQIIHLQRRNQPLFTDLDPKLLFRVVKAGFSNRRKTLLNSLSAGLHITKDEARDLLDQSHINPGHRPQELDLDDWIKIADIVAL